MHGRRIGARDPVSEADIAGASLLRRFHETHDFGQQRTLIRHGNVYFNRHRQVERSGKNRAAAPNILGNRFAGQQAGIEDREIARQHAVRWYPLTTRDSYPHAGFQLLRPYETACPIRLYHRCRARPNRQKAVRRRPRFRPRPQVQNPAEQQEEQKGDTGVEIDGVAARKGLVEAHARGEDYR